MEVKKAKIGNALTSVAPDHVVAVAEDIYDELKGRYQSDINEDAVKAKVVADKAAADIGVNSITLLIGGIDSDGSENTSNTYLRTGRYSTFKLEINDGYTIGQLAQYDLAGNFVALYNDYTQISEDVEWTPTSVVATDKNYYWVAIVFKGSSPNNNTTISPHEAVVKTFVSGLYYYMQGGESDPHSAAQQAKMVVDRTIEQLPNEEDLTLVDGKMQMANRAAAIKDGKVTNLGYVILRKDKSFAEQVTEPNCIYEIRYNFDLQDGTVELKDNCTLKFNGGKLANFKNLTLSNTIIEAPREHIFVVGEMLNKGVIDATEPSGNCNGEFESSIAGSLKNDKIFPEWFGAKADGSTDNSDAIQYALNTSYNVGGEVEFNSSAKQSYKVHHTIFLPPSSNMSSRNAPAKVYSESSGSPNKAEIYFTCRYLFRTKKNKSSDAESTRLTNNITVIMSGLKIMGYYSKPKITVDDVALSGFENELAINGDPFWVRKTYVFYGTQLVRSHITNVTAIYIGTFIYGSVKTLSLIEYNYISFARAFISGMKGDENNSTEIRFTNQFVSGDLNVPLHELGYDTTITYSNGKSYIGYVEEIPTLANKGGIIDSRIVHNYLNGNKFRPVCFLTVALAMTGVNNNYIDFCFAVCLNRDNLNQRCNTISNNIIDYCLHFCVTDFMQALITENQINRMSYETIANTYIICSYDNDSTNFDIYAKEVLNYKAAFIVSILFRNVYVVDNSFYNTDALNNFKGGSYWGSVRIKNYYINTPNKVICTKGRDDAYVDFHPCEDIYFDCFENVVVEEGYISDTKKIVPYQQLTVGSSLKMNTTYPSDIIDNEYNSKYEYINGELTVKNGKLNTAATPYALIIPGSRGICYNEDTKVWGYVNRLKTEYGYPYMPNGIRAHKGVGDTRPNTNNFNDDDIGFVFFDKSIGKPIWWNGTAWVDSTGAEV